MKDISEKLKSIVSASLPHLRKMNDEGTSIKKTPKQWSKKEIIGHLIDSCSNNHQRIVRALYNAADKFPPYDQNEWVRVQNYNEMHWNSLVGFWAAYNSHLCYIIEQIPESAKNAVCNIGNDKPVTLEFIVNDYIRHLKYHLAQVI